MEWALNKILHCSYLITDNEKDVKDNWLTLEAGEKNLFLKLSNESGVLTLRHGGEVLQMWDLGQSAHSVRVSLEKASLLIVKKIKSKVHKCSLFLKGEEGAQACTALFQILSSIKINDKKLCDGIQTSTLPLNTEVSECFKSNSQMSPSLLEPQLVEEEWVHSEVNRISSQEKKTNQIGQKTASKDDSLNTPIICSQTETVIAEKETIEKDSNLELSFGKQEKDSRRKPYFKRSSQVHCNSGKDDKVSQGTPKCSKVYSNLEERTPDFQSSGHQVQDDEVIEVIDIGEESQVMPKRKRGRPKRQSQEVCREFKASKTATSKLGEKMNFNLTDFQNEYTNATLSSIPDDILKQMVKECLMDPQLPKLVSRIHHIISHY